MVQLNNVRVVKRQHLASTGCVSPVSHEVSGNSKLRHHINAGSPHPVVRGSSYLGAESSRRVGVRENRVALLD